MRTIKEILTACTSYSEEQNWFEFKENWYEPNGIGEYISALSNTAAMLGKDEGYLIWGVQNKTHKLTDTKFNFHQDIKNEPLEHFLARNITPGIYFRFEEEVINQNRVVVLRIPAAHDIPTAYKGIRYLRIGSSKINLNRYPQREAELFRTLRKGLPNLLNTESRFSELTFNQLFLYYEMKGIKLDKNTFKENLELLTTEGKYNMLAQLLSDNPHIPIRFAVFKGKDKTSTMYAVREYGNMCVLLSIDKVLDFGEILNIPQADERKRVVERKEVLLFSKSAFREAVVNAFVHNLWINGDSPMFTAYEDRIEIVSPGSWLLPKDYNAYPAGSIPSIRRNAIIAACLDVANLMERGGTGFQTMIESYQSCPAEMQPVVSIYPGFLNLRLFDMLYRDEAIELDLEGLTDTEKVKAILKTEGPKSVKELQMALDYRSRNYFLNKVINPLIESGEIYRDGKPKSPTSVIKIKI